ncbi:extracellular solute-binding protein [Xylanimonas protaetiae]|nr:extracellular solute-binding protein [Xylanimonas protaetiae]
MTRKAAAGAATAITVAMLAAACGGGGNEAGSDGATDDPSVLIPDSGRVGAMENFEAGTTFRATEPISLELLYRVHPNYPIMDDWLINQAFEENQNVTFNREDVLMADWGQRRSILIGSGDFPSIVPVVWPGEETAWVAGGALLRVSDFFDYMPNLQHFMEEWDLEGDFETRRQEDGGIYILPGIRQSPNIEHSFAINVDLFEAAGITEDPKTWDEFAEQLQAVADATDVDYPLSDRWNNESSGPLGATLNMAAANFGTTAGWTRNVAEFDTDAGEFVPRITMDGYRELVQFFADLRADGLLDPEITQTDEAAIAKFINGRSAAISTNAQQMAQALVQGAADLGIELNTRMIVVPEGPAGSNVQGGRLGPGFVLNANLAQSPNFLATLQFIDWIHYSEEGREFAQWGVRGTTFDIDADGNRHYIGTVQGAGPVNEGADGNTPLNATFGFQDGVWMNTWGGSDELTRSVMLPEQIEWLEAMMDAKTILPVNPPTPFSESETESMNLVNEAVQSATESGVAAFIVGTRSMTEWDAFVQEILSLGAQQVADTHNTAYQRTRD